MKNLANTYGVVSAGSFPFAVPVSLGGTNAQQVRASNIRPRTIGASVGFSF